ncbi:MAG: RidA family protein [Chloroflexota bacterium]
MTVSIRHDPSPVEGAFHGIFAYGVETRANARVMHVSGQVGVAPNGDLPPDFAGQCRQAIWNVEEILREANMALTDIVKMTFYLVRREDIDDLLKVRMELLDGVRPAVTTLLVAGLFAPEWLIEIDVVACAA